MDHCLQSILGKGVDSIDQKTYYQLKHEEFKLSVTFDSVYLNRQHFSFAFIHSSIQRILSEQLHNRFCCKVKERCHILCHYLLYGLYWVNGFPHVWRLFHPLLPSLLSRAAVIELICHWVRLHYAVLPDKNIAKQLFPLPLSPPRGCVSKRRTSPPEPDIIIYFDFGGAPALIARSSHADFHVRALTLAFLPLPHVWCETELGWRRHPNHFGQVSNVELLSEIPSSKPCLV